MKCVRFTVLEMRSFQFNAEKSCREWKRQKEHFDPWGICLCFFCLWRRQLSTGTASFLLIQWPFSRLNSIGFYNYEKKSCVHSFSGLSSNIFKARKCISLLKFVQTLFIHTTGLQYLVSQHTKATDQSNAVTLSPPHENFSPVIFTSHKSFKEREVFMKNPWEKNVK